MIRVAIVEDEQKEREQLKSYVEQYFTDRGKEAQIRLYEDGAELVRQAPRDLDILLLDIQMKEVDGISAAKVIRQYDEEVLILFITNMVQYAIEGYSVNALDFVLKPVTQSDVAAELDKAMKRLEKRLPQMIRLRGSEGTLVVNAANISYAETYERRVLVHTSEGSWVCHDTLQSLEERLPAWFFRCHSAYLVNLRKVQRIVGSDVVIDGKNIPLSKHRKKEFMQAMTEYIREMM